MAKVTRRAFVAATAAAAILPAVLAQTPPAPPTTPAPPKPLQPQPAPALSPADQAEVDARVTWIFTKYAARLNDEQRADIRRIISSGQSGVNAMRAYPLDNSVEPATMFRVWQRTTR